MSDRREFYASTVEGAVEKAATALGVGGRDLEFEVVDEGSAGFLGIGARDARIAVQSPEISADAATDPAVPVPASEEQEQATPEEPVITEVPRTASGEEAEPENVIVAVSEDLLLAVDRFMTDLIEAMGFDATVDAYDAGEVIKVNVATAETGLFIGQKGETIDAVQYLLNVSMYKNRQFAKRIVVDTEGYRQRRIEAIQGMAHRTARRVQREKRSLSLPPMAAAERRVVHLYLQPNPNVTTTSEGQEEDRRVIVSPA